MSSTGLKCSLMGADLPASTPAATSPQVQWPLLVVLGAAAGGLAIALLLEWRVGAGVVGAAVGLGAVFRLALPERLTGLLRARSRAFDVTLLALMAAGIIIGAIVVPAAPGR